ncbi:MAG TPA: ATP-binding protein [Luteitalea sp.]|nr:ATP-binding protein [Luteitalea sp.]
MSLDLPEQTIRHLAKVVESSDDAIVSKDLNGIVKTWNRAAERLFGYSAEEAIGQSIRLIIPADRQTEEDEVIASIRAGRAVTHYETIRQRKDGSLIAISLSVSPIHDEHGKVVGASKIARDISEQVRLREAARQHAANTEKLAQAGAAVAADVERDAIVQKVTDVATELTGAQFGAFFYNVRDSSAGDAYMLYTLSGAPKDAFSKFPHPRSTAVFGPTFRGEGPVRLHDVTKDPRYGKMAPHFGMPEGHLPVRGYLAVPVKSAAGEVLGGLFFGHSSPGVFSEEHERLAAGIAGWASVALENARLLIEARNANRMKDEFLAVLSHELRTPLNAISGYAQMLRGGVLTGKKAAEGFEALERNAKALAQIVDDVLDVSRIVFGQLRLDVQPVELPLVIENAVATVRPAADAKGVRLQLVLDRAAAPVAGDPIRLQQVVWNLLSNAVKFTPKGGRVQVRLQRVNSHVELNVSDSGIGIAPDFLPYVFERFRQADSSLTRKTGGLGLGLAIVRHIIEMHGGTVEAASAGKDQGSTFAVHLPVMIVHKAETPSRQHPRTELLAPIQGLSGLDGVKIVAVDDEPDALGLLEAVLKAAGADVHTFADPTEALDRLAAIDPDALVADIGMPQMDGYEFIRRVRSSADAAVRAIPAAALTAFARAQDRTNALLAGFEMHLAKPVDPGELVASVVTLVRRRRIV